MAKIVFIQEVYYPYDAIMQLSASLKSSANTVELVIGSKEKIVEDLLKKNTDKSIDLIAASPLTLDRISYFNIFSEIKESGIKVPIIVGGVDVTLTPEIYEKNKNVDMLCLGEGEEPIVELASALDNDSDYSGISNLWVKLGGKTKKNLMRPLIKELDTIPFYDRDIYRDYHEVFRNPSFTCFRVGRGCPYSCSFCFKPRYREVYEVKSSQYLRHRSTEHCIEELSQLKNKYSVDSIYFTDATLLSYGRVWIKEFLLAYREHISLPFSANVVANELNNIEILKLLKEAGCYQLRAGLEAGDEELRKEILHKPIKDSQFYKAATLAEKAGLPIMWNYMMGFPTERIDQAYNTIKVLQTISKPRGNTINGSFLVPFPDTILIREAKEKGLVVEDYERKFFECNNIDQSIIKLPERSEMFKLFVFSDLAVSFPRLFPFIKMISKLPIPRPVLALFQIGMSVIQNMKKLKNIKLKFAIQNLYLNGLKLFK